MSTFKALLPSVAEQARVAAVLQDMDKAIGVLERLIAKKQSVKQGMMQQLLTGRTRLPGFEEEWDWYTFPEVMSRLNTGESQVPSTSYRPAGQLPVVDQGQRLIVAYTDYFPAAIDPGAAGVIVFGDHTCITKFVDFSFAVGAEGTQVLKAKAPNVTRFMAYALEHDPVQSTGYNRHFKFLREKIFPAPGAEEQHTIATVLSEVDEEIDVLNARLKKARDMKTGMMQQLLSGRVRLPAEVPA